MGTRGFQTTVAYVPGTKEELGAGGAWRGGHRLMTVSVTEGTCPLSVTYVAAGSNAGSLTQSKVRVQTHILMDSSWFLTL